MNGVSNRDPSGSRFHEHNQEGRSMNAILRPEAIEHTRGMRATTPKAEIYSRSSAQIGNSNIGQKRESVNPASTLKPNSDFRKAYCASSDRLWTPDNDFAIYADKQQSRHEVCKSRSRDRYFTSSISTLPGPTIGLNCVKTRELNKMDTSHNDQIQRKKGHGNNAVFSSHINTLPGKHTAAGNTQDEQEFKEQRRQDQKYNDPAFRIKNEVFYGSYMMDKDKGRDTDVPKEFTSYRKGGNETTWNRAPSTVSNEARNRIVYKSNFTLA